MTCHVLGHVQPCKASFCAEIEREHQAVRRQAIEECAVVARNMTCHDDGERALREDTVVHIMALLTKGKTR